jgi:hypothetical protein
MAKPRASVQMKGIISKLQGVIKDAAQKKALKPTADFARDVIVKRTRLGYGVERNYGYKEKLKPLSPNYIKSRKMFAKLDGFTTPRKSNLTRTGDMLRSIEAKVSNGVIEIVPTGTRSDGKKNVDIARYNQEGGKGRPRRIFMRISDLEFKQVVRFYRKTFGDLLRKTKVI